MPSGIKRLKIILPDGKEYDPLPKQAAFHSSKAKYRAYIGGFGSGKTLCGAIEMFLTAMENPGGNFLIARWSYKELRETSWDTFLSIIPREILALCEHNRNEMTLKLPNGSRVTGWNLQEMKRLTSLNLSAWWLDEVTEVDENVYRQLVGRLRNAKGPRRAWVTGNPAGRDWVWALFVNKQLDNHEFIHAPTQENRHLPEDYVESLRAVYPEEWISKYMSGSFDVFEGQVFPMWSPDVHVISTSQTFQIPEEWLRFRGIDHGITNPTACVWGATDFAGNLYIYNEYYRKNRTIQENSAAILAQSIGEHYEWTVIDPATRQTDSVLNKRHIDVYRDAGIVPLLEGNNSIRDSIARIQEMLRVDPNHRHPLTGEMGAPRLFVFPTCVSTIWEMSQYQWKAVRAGSADKEEPIDRHNHAIAAMRYMIMNEPRRTEETPQASRYKQFIERLSREHAKNNQFDEDNLRDVVGNQNARFF